MKNTRKTKMKRSLLRVQTIAALGMVSMLATMLPYASAVPIQYTIQDLTGLDTSIVRNDGVLVALNAGEEANGFNTYTVNGVDFKGITTTDGGLTGQTTTNGITLSYSGSPDLHNTSYGADARNRYNHAGSQNKDNCADWGENAGCVPGVFGGNTSGIMENAVRTIEGSTSIPGIDPEVFIGVQVSGLTVGKSYRLQFLMDVADENRRTAVVHDGQSTGQLLTGLLGNQTGKSVLATFTADATIFDINVHGWESSRALLNALAFSEVAALGQPGDFDGDGDVDGADFLSWQRDTNVGSLSDWETNFGTSNVSAASVSSFSAVPEPSSAILLIGGMTILLRGSSRSRTLRK